MIFAQKPPMGWNAWNYFGYADINERVVRETADAMAEQGFRDAGYVIVQVDDAWALQRRDENGDLVADPERFPSGMKALGDYIHSLGMKFGLYAGAGVMTYANCCGSYGHERRDAKLFASWGVDVLKYDFGYIAPGCDIPTLFRRMGQALRESGRDIMLAACYGSTDITPWIRSTGASMWRLSGDIQDSWQSILSVAKNAFPLGGYSAPGGWNDPDMMVVGLDGQGFVGKIGGGCTLEEYSAHFSIWCMLSAPLLMGHDVRNTKPEIAKILLNPELIAVNQDDLGIQAYTLPPMSNGDIILAKPLYGGDIAFCLVNDWDTQKRMILSWQYCGWEVTDKVFLRDMVNRCDVGIAECGWDVIVPPHSAVIYRATRL